MKPNYELKPAMEKLGIKQLRSYQLKPIQSLKDGEDTIVIAGTSSGKSKIYEIPGLLHKKKLTLVLEPTLSLIYNQVQDLQDHGVKADYLDHFRTKKDVQKIYEKIRLAKKISDCESITAAQKRLKMKRNDVIKLLKKFRQIGLNPICRQETID